MQNLLSQANPFGQVTPPSGLSARFGTDAGIAIGRLIGLSLRVLVIAAGIYAVINLVLAGYSFMSAGDDSKKVAGAWAKIWQTLLGLAFIAGSFVLAAIFGKLIYGDYNAILSPSSGDVSAVRVGSDS